MSKRKQCIVCGCSLVDPLYDPGQIPLSCLDIYLTDSKDEAINAPRVPMAYYQCQRCGHIFNPAFDPVEVDYEAGTTIMYNSTPVWRRHIHETANMLTRYVSMLDSNKTVIIGSGDGTMLEYMNDTLKMDVIGFEPGITKECNNVVIDYFDPERDLPIYNPSLFVCRHVLEHLQEPREFLSDIMRWCTMYDMYPYMYFEVPNFEKALEQGRLCDLVYGHVSNFTLESLQMVFDLSNLQVKAAGHSFNDEVIWVVATPMKIDRELDAYNKMAMAPYKNLRQLENPVVWGGSGKCASFLNMYQLDHVRVVDSDPRKHGKYVPGTGNLIEDPKTVTKDDNILIPNVWRARDIYDEITLRHLAYKKIFVPIEGKLHEYKTITARL